MNLNLINTAATRLFDRLNGSELDTFLNHSTMAEQHRTIKQVADLDTLPSEHREIVKLLKAVTS